MESLATSLRRIPHQLSLRLQPLRSLEISGQYTWLDTEILALDGSTVATATTASGWSRKTITATTGPATPSTVVAISGTIHVRPTFRALETASHPVIATSITTPLGNSREGQMYESHWAPEHCEAANRRTK